MPVIILALLMTACNSDEPAGEPATVAAEGTYTGTMVVDQNDGTFYTQDSVNVVFTPTEAGKAEIKMLKSVVFVKNAGTTGYDCSRCYHGRNIRRSVPEWRQHCSAGGDSPISCIYRYRADR